MNTPMDKPTSRRDFLKTSAILGSALAAPAILPGKLFGAETNGETLKVGLIGCGGRGTGAATQALNADKNVVLWAMGDAFEDRLQGSLKALKDDKDVGSKVKVDPEHCFVGFDAYQKVIDSGVDVVLLTTPPGFRPMHLKAAVAAGKHVFCEKPVAVDAPGVRSVLASAEEARKKKLSLLSGFCYRYSKGERELVKRIHDGEIGDVTSIYNSYNTSPVWCHPRQEGWTDMQAQMRNWYYYTWLSGDHIVEQAIHNINKMAWVMNDVAPVKAIAVGGRQVRTQPEFGHIYDHFAVVYDYPNGVKGIHMCRQWENCANEGLDWGTGTKGSYKIVPFQSQELKVTGGNTWKNLFKNQKNMYQVEHDEFFASIRSGNPMNDGKMMADSTLVAIMGRMAAYTGEVVTWDQALNSQEVLAPEKIDWDVKLTEPAVAIPGKTKVV
ncbi:Gfo/Idh/MocA family oxidoreductase [Pedosphaera parvula]|uniref:Oxidoreductase domain protein n=1 Tax=Pedosphaera parvula (strain Ellin514) TaxID=320771 RepID=B9XT51_PEDPL|nr:Gfo/Idh/MocA family oxidoreductase [Pedosphaera parvula]EEF56986.1 oxidoreductase domain protein [Pedosphaera parvula Ellin514]